MVREKRAMFEEFGCDSDNRHVELHFAWNLRIAGCLCCRFDRRDCVLMCCVST